MGTRGLVPREHGAYAQIGLPLIAAVASGTPGPAAMLLASAALCAFFAHEPARVAWGHRGTRAQREHGARARARLLVLGSSAFALACLGLLVSSAARVPALLVLPFVLAAGGVAARDVDRTWIGEAIAGAALPGMAVPVAVASGVGLLEAVAGWYAWTFAFALSTSAVRALTARSPAERQRLPALVVALSVAGVVAVVSGLRIVAAVAPIATVAIAVVVLHPSARHIRRVGWAFAGAVVTMAVSLVVHARMTG